MLTEKDLGKLSAQERHIELVLLPGHTDPSRARLTMPSEQRVDNSVTIRRAIRAEQSAGQMGHAHRADAHCVCEQGG